jgi:hypothetical protein
MTMKNVCSATNVHCSAISLFGSANAKLFVQLGQNDMALIQLEGVWQNRLAAFQVHGNVNIRNELR